MTKRLDGRRSAQPLLLATSQEFRTRRQSVNASGRVAVSIGDADIIGGSTEIESTSRTPLASGLGDPSGLGITHVAVGVLVCCCWPRAGIPWTRSHFVQTSSKQIPVCVGQGGSESKTVEILIMSGMDKSTIGDHWTSACSILRTAVLRIWRDSQSIRFSKSHRLNHLSMMYGDLGRYFG